MWERRISRINFSGLVAIHFRNIWNFHPWHIWTLQLKYVDLAVKTSTFSSLLVTEMSNFKPPVLEAGMTKEKLKRPAQSIYPQARDHRESLLGSRPATAKWAAKESEKLH